MKTLIIIMAITLAILVGCSSKSQKNIKVKQKFQATKKVPRIKKQSSNLPKKQSEKKQVTLYFAKGSYLEKEQRPADDNTPEAAIKALLEGSKEGNINYIPAKVRLLSFKLGKGQTIVNFSKEILDPGNVGAEAEELAVYSIVNTLTEFESVKAVTIQIEGKTEGEIEGLFIEDFWGHIGLYDQPFKRNESLIKM